MRANMGSRVSHAFAPAAAAACLLLLLTPLAGCGASRPGLPATPAPPDAAGSGPGSPAGSAVPVPASSRCTAPARLTADRTLASWRLGAVHFVSPGTGLAITAPQIPCAVPAGNGQGTNILAQAQPVMLAVSADVGHRWVTEGSALPSSQQAPGFEIIEQVTALSAQNVWVLTSLGRLFATGNGGLTWTLQPLPAPVVTLAQAGGELIALSCPLTRHVICHPELRRMRLPDGRWQTEPLPRLATLTFPQLSIASAGAAVLLIAPYPAATAELVSTTDGGARWTASPVPAGPDRLCARIGGGPLIATASASEWWLLCGAAMGMGEATQAVMRTQDGGRTWRVMAETPSVPAAAAPGSLPYGDPLAFAAFSPTLLWTTSNNYVAFSRNAGRSWTVVTAVNPQGAPGLFDILTPCSQTLRRPKIRPRRRGPLPPDAPPFVRNKRISRFTDGRRWYHLSLAAW